MSSEPSRSFFNSFAPIPSTTILGRGQEIIDILGLLKSHRIVTITGTGGIGKTRLVIEICHRINIDLWDNAYYVSMATLTDARAIIPTLANKLGVLESANRSLATGIYENISVSKTLLVIDNLEHISSAPIEIAELILNCPNVHILCTSRTPLKIIAEQEFALHTLPLPSQSRYDSLLEFPSIELFVRSAKKVNRAFELTIGNFETIIKICKYLDGLPLALELAAFRLKVLSPSQLLKRLSKALNILSTDFRDIPLRHKTLINTIRWSFDLLNKKEKVLFRRLSVFKQGFSIEAVEQVCYESGGKKECIEELSSLVDKGLVQRIDSNARFTLLQTIKDFAKEKLSSADEMESISMKHAAFFYDMTELIKEGTQGKQQQERMNLGALEEANILAALDFLLLQAKLTNNHARELGLLICGNLWMYWHITGKHKTTKEYVYSFFDTTENQSLSLGESSALFSAYVAHFTLGEIDQCEKVATRLFNMVNHLNNELEMVKGYIVLGFSNMFSDIEQALQFNEKAIQLGRQTNNTYWLGFLLWQAGAFNLIAGKLKRAKEAYSESLNLFLSLNDNEGKGIAQSGLSMLEFIAGDYDTALSLYLDCLAAFKTVGDRPEQARILSEISWVYLAKQNTDSALKYALESIKAYQEVGSDRGIGLSMNGLAAFEALRGRPKKAIEIATAALIFASQKGIAVEYGANNHGEVYIEDAKKKLSSSDIKQAIEVGANYTLKDVLDIVNSDLDYSKQVGYGTAENTFIKKLQIAIDKNLSDADFGVNQLYDAVLMSQMQVYRKLKTLTQQTPSQFIRSYRLQKSKELLTLSDKTIAEIAYEVGFTDPNYFSKVFKKEFGKTPRAYRGN